MQTPPDGYEGELYQTYLPFHREGQSMRTSPRTAASPRTAPLPGTVPRRAGEGLRCPGKEESEGSCQPFPDPWLTPAGPGAVPVTYTINRNDSAPYERGKTRC